MAAEGYSFGVAGFYDGLGGLGLEASCGDDLALEYLAQLFGSDGSLRRGISSGVGMRTS